MIHKTTIDDEAYTVLLAAPWINETSGPKGITQKKDYITWFFKVVDLPNREMSFGSSRRGRSAVLFTNLAGLWFKELSTLDEDVYGSSSELTADVVRALRYPTFTVGAEPRERHHHQANVGMACLVIEWEDEHEENEWRLVCEPVDDGQAAFFVQEAIFAPLARLAFPDLAEDECSTLITLGASRSLISGVFLSSEKVEKIQNATLSSFLPTKTAAQSEKGKGRTDSIVSKVVLQPIDSSQSDDSHTDTETEDGTKDNNDVIEVWDGSLPLLHLQRPASSESSSYQDRLSLPLVHAENDDSEHSNVSFPPLSSLYSDVDSQHRGFYGTDTSQQHLKREDSSAESEPVKESSAATREKKRARALGATENQQDAKIEEQREKERLEQLIQARTVLKGSVLNKRKKVGQF